MLSLGKNTFPGLLHGFKAVRLAGIVVPLWTAIHAVIVTANTQLPVD
jgi:hypothetical protein